MRLAVTGLQAARMVKIPSKETLESYVARGLTHQQMADEWRAESGEEVSRAAMSMALARLGVAPKEEK